MQRNLRVRFAKYLQHKRNFMKVAIAAFGLPFAAAVLWMFGKYGGIGWWLLLVALVVPVSWLWAFFMWRALEDDIRRMSSDSPAQKVNEGAGE